MKTFKNSVSIVVLAFALTACATTPPQPVKPDDMPKAYQAPATDADKEVTADWWKSFSNTELTAMVDEAHTGNLDIATAAARLEQAQAQTGISTADLFPTVGATYSEKRQGSRAANSNNFGLSGAASYELDLFGKNVNSLRAARNTAKAAVFYQDAVRLSTEANVANAYFAVLALRERIDIARKNVEAAKRILAITQAKVSNGVLSNLELAQQTSTVLGEEATIPRLEELEREQRNALAILLGRNPGSLKVDAATLEGITAPPVKAGLPSNLLTRRPDVAQAEASLLAAHADLDAARAAFLPTISLTAGGGWANSALTGLVAPQTLAWNIGASVAQTIFDGGRLTSARDAAKGRENELIASYKAAVLSALNDTETQLGSVSSYGDQERLTTDQVKNAQEAFRISELQYREGVVDLLTVLQAQQTLFQAQDSLIQIKLARLQSGVGLYRALGGGWDVTKEDSADLRNTFVPVPDFTDLPVGLPF
jgi:efflux transporter, outer membrane factor (OMF) lipoprotein, NodT family